MHSIGACQLLLETLDLSLGLLERQEFFRAAAEIVLVRNRSPQRLPARILAAVVQVCVIDAIFDVCDVRALRFELCGLFLTEGLRGVPAIRVVEYDLRHGELRCEVRADR